MCVRETDSQSTEPASTLWETNPVWQCMQGTGSTPRVTENREFRKLLPYHRLEACSHPKPLLLQEEEFHAVERSEDGIFVQLSHHMSQGKAKFCEVIDP